MQHRKNTMIRKNEKDLIQEIYILEQKIKTQAIIQEIYILEQNKNTSNNSNEHIHSLSNVRQALDTLYDNKMNGILLRSKASHVENNGKKKNSSYFANLEKKYAEQKMVKCLKVNDRVITNRKESLIEECK